MKVLRCRFMIAIVAFLQLWADHNKYCKLYRRFAKLRVAMNEYWEEKTKSLDS
jgi:hypothetical protein